MIFSIHNSLSHLCRPQTSSSLSLSLTLAAHSWCLAVLASSPRKKKSGCRLILFWRANFILFRPEHIFYVLLECFFSSFIVIKLIRGARWNRFANGLWGEKFKFSFCSDHKKTLFQSLCIDFFYCTSDLF